MRTLLLFFAVLSFAGCTDDSTGPARPPEGVYTLQEVEVMGPLRGEVVVVSGTLSLTSGTYTWQSVTHESGRTPITETYSGAAEWTGAILRLHADGGQTFAGQWATNTLAVDTPGRVFYWRRGN